MNNAAVDAPIATKPAMTASENHRSRGCDRRSSVAVASVISAHPQGNSGPPIGCFLAAGPGKEHDASGYEEIHAATDPHQQSAKLLILDRAERRNTRRRDVGCVIGDPSGRE